ncbi:MAG: N-6 DNA methylase, partial [Anaerolineae bacterium]|nr:N-6 DNA methylase [Anaerolineae bacterium]
MSSLETYLHTLTTLRGATVPETSYYAALQTLLNEIGGALRPRVQAVIHPKDSGAGIPDLGLYDDNQPADQKPARGIIEAKPVSDDLLKIAHGEQVARYVAHYGQALVTNYYQFVLVTRNAQTGQPVIEERYDIAPSAGAFWEAAKHPRTLAQKHETALRETLMRVMRRNAPLSTPQDVAWILASYAREARARIEAGGSDLAALNTIRGQLEASLGVRFEDETAEDFFRSTLVQTLFYGLFSAWVLWHETHPGAGKFDLWRDTRRMEIPVISELFEQFSSGTALPLSVEQILEWTADALNRVDRAAFFTSFNKGAAVQYFYEPFLEAFDPELRRQLGVWYTPPEVVEYMVSRVDAALKTELGIADGLADPSVFVLDPCCGTGAYLVAVLRHIYAALRQRDGEALAAQAVQQAMRERVFGFEILPSPFVVAHLQIGMMLNALHAPLAQGQRAGVYLTNALTGWEPPKEPKTALMFPELQKERDAADAVKRSRPILVILGNPPYSGFAGVAIEEERTLTEAYRTTQNPNLPRPQGQGLNDLYVRFYRMAERQIAETTQRGVVCFISNYSWLDGLSHTGMRERYLDVFDQIIIDNLNGDKYKTGKTTSDGKPDPSIFSTEFSREGIQVGTAIATLIRKPAHTGAKAIQFRHVWGTGKRAQLQADGASLNTVTYQPITPALEIGLPYLPHTVGADYFAWAKLPELFPVSFPGVNTGRDAVFVHLDKEKLLENVTSYFEAKALPLPKTDNVFKLQYRPLDIRYLYWHERELDRARPEYIPHVHPENLWLLSQQRVRKDWSPAQVVREIGSMHLEERGGSYFPLYLYTAPQQAQLGLFETEALPLSGRRPNLSEKARADLAGVFSSPPAPSPMHGEGGGVAQFSV